jgi:hypothetical protein
MINIDRWDRLYVAWAFFLQIVLIVHFALRKVYFESYTLKYGWIVYALCIPAAVISIFLLLNGKSWSFWLGGFLFLAYSAYGYWIDFVQKLSWRNPFSLPVGIPYVLLYLSTVMFYWWPLGQLSRPLWIVYAILFVIATILNVTSH